MSIKLLLNQFVVHCNKDIKEFQTLVFNEKNPGRKKMLRETLRGNQHARKMYLRYLGSDFI